MQLDHATPVIGSSYSTLQKAKKRGSEGNGKNSAKIGRFEMDDGCLALRGRVRLRVEQ
jgi:hypothetical protein